MGYLKPKMDNLVFDPIKFLELGNLPIADQDRLRPQILRHMAFYLIQIFLNNLGPKEFDEIEKLTINIKSYEEVIDLISYYNPDFPSQKRKYLENYKNEFDVRLFF